MSIGAAMNSYASPRKRRTQIILSGRGLERMEPRLLLAHSAQVTSLVQNLTIGADESSKAAHVVGSDMTGVGQTGYDVTVSSQMKANAKAYAQNVASFARAFLGVRSSLYNSSQVLPASDGVALPSVSYSIQATRPGQKSHPVTLYRGHEVTLNNAQIDRITQQASLFLSRLQLTSQGGVQIKLTGAIRSALAPIPEAC